MQVRLITREQALALGCTPPQDGWGDYPSPLRGNSRPRLPPSIWQLLGQTVSIESHYYHEREVGIDGWRVLPMLFTPVDCHWTPTGWKPGLLDTQTATGVGAMENIRARKRRFATLPKMQAMGKVRCGFELETQRVDGMTYTELTQGEPEFDEDAFDQAVHETVSYALRSKHIMGDLSRGQSWKGIRAASPLGVKLAALYDPEVSDRSLQAALEVRGPDDPTYKYLEDDLADHFRDWLPRDDYYNQERSDDGELNLDLPAGIVAKEDGSVAGVEFTTEDGGVTAAKFSQLLKRLLARFDLRVDSGCSFHIHLSVPGINHEYGAMLQACMMEYLLNNLKRVPDCVAERWRKGTGYFRPRISTDKYSFVRFHRDLGTWEFRCFGNVKTHKDGMRCLQLAVEALQYAYRVQLGLEKSELRESGDWNPDIYHEVIHNSETVPTAIKKYRREAA